MDASQWPSAARTHGGWLDPELRRLSARREPVLDFSVNINPYGPCPAVLQALREARVDRYPDPEAREPRAALAEQLNLEATEIALGHGAVELLWTLALQFARARATCLIVEPTFGEFRAALAAHGAEVLEWRATPRADFALNLTAIEAVVREQHVQVVYLCAPNTPTGACPAASELAYFAERNPKVTVVLDQSFLSLSRRHAEAQQRFTDNVVRVRSLTKEHAIPGARVGYLLGSTQLVQQIDAARPAWSVSAFAQAATLACCAAQDFVAQSRERWLDDCALLSSLLRARGFSVIESSTVFCLTEVGDARGLQKRLWQRHGILVRDCTSFGLPSFVRLSARPRGECEVLLRAINQERL